MKAPLIITAIAVISSSLLGGGYNEGKSTAKTITSHYKADMASTINKPMTANADMKTVDGTKTFSGANVSCASTTTAPFFQMGYSVNTDGEIVLSSGIDTDLDGSFDTNSITWTASDGSSIGARTISGVCLQGAVSCDSGTWENCDFYKWAYLSGELYLTKASSQVEVGTCQCSNNSCGATSTSQGSTFLDMLSNGAATKIIGTDGRLTISRVDRQVSSITYWGQDYSNCNSNGMSYSNYSGSLESRGQQAQLATTSDPNSASYVMLTSSRSQESSATTKLNYFSTNSFGSPTIDSNTSDKIFSRQAAISSSTIGTETANGYSMSYGDTYVDADGNTVSTTGEASIQTGVAEAPTICTVSWLEASSDVFSDSTTRTQSNATDLVKKMESRECTDNICPVTSGEIIERNCAQGTQKELFQMTARVQGIQEASQDMICSQN